eukprot:s3973_g2.t1
MTPSEEARKILGESADDQAIIKLVDFVVQTREAEAKAQADAREAKAQADAREACAHQLHLEQDKLRLEAELFCVLHSTELNGLSTKSRFSAILCNRFLIEAGLINLYPKATLSKGHRTFKIQLMQKKTEGQGPRLTSQGRTLFNCIVNQTNMTAKQIHVATELDDLIHHLSSAADLVASIKSMSGSSAPLPSLEN